MSLAAMLTVRGDSTSNGIGRPLAGLLLVAVLPLIVFGGGVAWLIVDHKKAAVEAELVSTASALRVAVDLELASQFSAMDVLLTDSSLDAGNFAAFQERARRALLANKKWLNVGLIDLRSHKIVAGWPAVPTPTPTSLSILHVDKVALTAKPLIVGTFTSSKLTPGPIVLLMSPVIRENKVRYVLGVAMNPKSISEIFVDQQLPATWTGAVVDHNMLIAGRSRDPERHIGVRATPTLVDRIAASHHGLFTALNQEGATVYTVFDRSPVTEWTLAIGVPAAEVETPIKRLLGQLLGAGGALIALAVMITAFLGRGIVRRRNAYEQDLQHSQTRLQLALSGADLATWDWNIRTGVTAFNARWAEMLGYTSEDLGSEVETWEKRVFPDDLPLIREQFNLHFAGKCPVYESEHRVRHKDGHWVWVQARGKCVEWDDADSPVRVMGTVLDITERKQAEEKLLRNEARIASILESAADAIFITDLQGGYQYVNHEAVRLLGYTRDQLLQMKFREITPAEDLPEVMNLFGELLAKGSLRTELRLKSHDGHLIPVDFNGTVLPDGSVFGSCRDITARKAAEAELDQHRNHLEHLVEERTAALSIAKEASEVANRAKTVFLKNMSHELRTPMTGIMGLTSLAQHREKDPKVADYLSKVMSSSQLLLALIDEILDISKFESEHFSLEANNFNLNGVLETLRDLNEQGIREKSMGLVIGISSNLSQVPLRGDAPRLNQVLGHLVSNAVKFSLGGSIFLCISVIEECPSNLLVRFEVEDSGIGISTEDQQRIFNIFEQADGSSTRKYGGAGLGLAISKRLTKAMGGSIGVDSEVGRGSTFWFTARLAKAVD